MIYAKLRTDTRKDQRGQTILYIPLAGPISTTDGNLAYQTPQNTTATIPLTDLMGFLTTEQLAMELNSERTNRG